MKLTFLGTSGGIPTVERGMPAISLKFDRYLFLFDCGEGTQRQMMRYKVGYGSVDGIFITHPHLDHYLGLFGFLETLKLTNKRHLSIVGPRQIELRDYDFVEYKAVRKGTVFEKPGFRITAHPVRHTTSSYLYIFEEDPRIKFHELKAKALGISGKGFSEIQKRGKLETGRGTVKLEDVSYTKPGRKIVYTGDLRDSSIADAIEGADILIHEATFATDMEKEAQERMHSTALDAATVAKKASVKKLILTHISPRYSDPSILLSESTKIFKNTVVAEDGMVVDV